MGLDVEQLRLLAAEATTEEWIEGLVYIEDRDSGTPIPFRLWPAQREALRDIEQHRLVIILKARQMGLTWLALAYAVRRMVQRPGYWVTALSRGGNEARELARRVAFIVRHLPGWLVKRGHAEAPLLGWDATTERVIIEHPGAEPAVFQSLPASQDAGRTFTSSLVILDEWAYQEYAREIWSAAYPTINRPGGQGQVIGISTGRTGTLFEEIWRGAVTGANGFHPIFLPWWSDPRRTPEWYEQVKRDLPTAYRAEYPSTPEEAWTAGEGAAFPEWSAAIHAALPADWYPPAGWKIVRAYDPGWVRACCKWYAIDPDGNAVCYREYYPSQVPDDQQAAEIRRLSRDPKGNPEDIAYTVADPSAWGKSRSTGESTAEIFARHGIPMRQADNDRIGGWRRLHQWLRPEKDEETGEVRPRLRFTQACRHSIRAYATVPCDEHRPDDVAEHPDDHLLDCDRYFVMSRPHPPLTPEERRKRERRRERMIEPVVSEITGY